VAVCLRVTRPRAFFYVLRTIHNSSDRKTALPDKYRMTIANKDRHTRCTTNHSNQYYDQTAWLSSLREQIKPTLTQSKSREDEDIPSAASSSRVPPTLSVVDSDVLQAITYKQFELRRRCSAYNAINVRTAVTKGQQRLAGSHARLWVPICMDSYISYVTPYPARNRSLTFNNI
jgi:hypothetical protein